jgi:hypothetical protein
VEKTVMEMRNKKSTGDDAPGVVLLGEDGLRIITQFINRMHGTGEWLMNFTEFTILIYTMEQSPS